MLGVGCGLFILFASFFCHLKCRPSDVFELRTNDKGTIRVYGESNLDQKGKAKGMYTGEFHTINQDL
jgi:hypothetical protein